MALTRAGVAAEFGGWPFLDPGFRSRRLLAAAACVRWARQHTATPTRPTPAQLSTVLGPGEAARIRRLDLHLDLPADPLTLYQQAQADDAMTGLAAAFPDWAPLLALPIRFLRLDDDHALSASAFAIPQHVYLADPAFADTATLDEQLVHELCHQWLYLVEELHPLHHPGCQRRLTLPSGTPNRSVAEVLGALHVAVTVHRLWQERLNDDPRRPTRLTQLNAYAAGCTALLTVAADCLTPDGRDLAHRLQQHADQP
ncbi:aKG-HExxH-type peptide beta-hydroxylase [Frankia gtarii]|uniref:aKG-HExxH-type peptide beta-hydroxylase n=1 Tax=Frankia gtarii TaxID=2950102 RepID=UPI0021BFEACC|nr:HEXXH motif-containing putative peptide modification protein [Frankia gtarii]